MIHVAAYIYFVFSMASVAEMPFPGFVHFRQPWGCRCLSLTGRL